MHDVREVQAQTIKAAMMSGYLRDIIQVYTSLKAKWGNICNDDWNNDTFLLRTTGIKTLSYITGNILARRNSAKTFAASDRFKMDHNEETM
jgi:hypothetical protein